MSHPFGDLLSQHLHRKHSLSQSKLAAGILQDPAVIGKMCKGQRLNGPQARERVLAIVEWLREQGALTTAAEANALLEAAGMASLRASAPSETTLLLQLGVQPEDGLAGAPRLATLELAPAQTETLGRPPRLKLFAVSTKVDWGEAPDVSQFYGRQTEVEQLHQWLTDDQCRLVAVLGIGGIGKTALATLTAASVQAQFSAVIWRSLRNAPPLAELLNQCIQVLSNYQEVELPVAVDERLALLMEYLRGQRCLLVLDNFETVLAGERPGHYLPGYEGYGQLLKQISEGRHQSCLLLTSREKPRELIPLAGEAAPVRALVLPSLDLADGRALLHDRGLRGSDENWSVLHQHYSGNPLALQIVSETIRELFDGDIAQFLRQETIVFAGITDLLEQQFARLSPLEQEVMFWLAVERGPVTPEELGKDLVQRPSRQAVLAALHALRQRSLVERTQTGFTLQNVMLEYVTATLIEQVAAEISTGNAVLLQRYALFKASAKSYVRESQRNLILGPIAQRVVEHFGRLELKERFSAILSHLRHTQARKPGYAGGSILNLLVQSGIDLRGQDFTRLAVWQADLRNVTAHDMDFRQADLAQSAFTDTFGGVLSVVFSPDGQRLAAGTMDNEIRMWRAGDGKPLLTWVAHPGWVRSVCFSPDGNVLASGGGDRKVRLWNAYDGIHQATFQGHSNDITAVCFSPDGNILASSSADHTVRLWDSHTGQCLAILEGHTKALRSVCFSPDGEVLASGSDDETVRLWDIHTGACLHLLRGHTQSVPSVCFSPDGRILASGGGEPTVRLWDGDTGVCLSLLQGHTAWIWSVCFSPDGEVLASGSDDQTVRLWDSHTGECLHHLRGHTGGILSVGFSPDGDVLASAAGDQTVRLWDGHTGACLHQLQGYTNNVLSVCFSPDGSILASGSADHAVRLWDRQTGACLRVLHGHAGWIWSVCFSPDGKMLASGSDDEKVRLWVSHTGECLSQLQGHTGWIWSVCFSPDGEVLASAGDDQKVRLWDRHTGECLSQLQGHSNTIQAVCFSPDGSVLASGSEDETVRLWDRHTGACLHLLQGHTGWIWSVCFSPDGKVLVSASSDQTVRLWDVHTGKSLNLMQGHTGWVLSVCFSPDGEVLASAGDDRTVRLWDVRTGESLSQLQGHTNSVKAVCFSPDGEVVASASADGTIRLWDVNTGACLRTLRSDRPYERMNITEATGLTPAQFATLKRLGAIDDAGRQNADYLSSH